MSYAIQIENLSKSYGKNTAIQDIHLNIEEGTIFGFIGPNGAGKSTTIKCMMNLIRSNTGEVCIQGKPLSKNREAIREIMGYLPSEIHLYEDLTVKKMLDYAASFYKKDCSKRRKQLVDKLEVEEDKKIDELSLGNLKKVGIVIAFMHEPKIVIMDEATSGLDPLMQEKFYEILLEEKKKKTTIFFSSHILSEVKRICDNIAIIKDGKIVKVERIQDLQETNMVKVKIVAQHIEELEKALAVPVLEKKDNQIQFIYTGDIDQLLKIVSQYTVSKFLVEELDIEEIFMHYYQ
ncbi:MAG: ABC transporter ATP-binding protein [Clostridia bacterium]